MGTRNLTMVINKDGNTKIAQYGQWDGYPSGQGATALKFLHENDMEKFNEKLKIVRFQTDEDSKEVDEFLTSIGSKDGWMTLEQSELYHQKYPLLTRNNGAAVLQMVMDSEENPIRLVDSTNFAGDGLFCEWAYVIDLKKRTFEVYKGFSEEPLAETERFYQLSFQTNEEGKKEKYSPVKLVKEYSLDALPTEEEFLDFFEKRDAEEEAAEENAKEE